MSTMMFHLYINQTDENKYKVEPAHTDQPLATCNTQQEAIDWAKRNYPNYPCHVARVRKLNDKNKPDHWRKVH